MGNVDQPPNPSSPPTFADARNPSKNEFSSKNSFRAEAMLKELIEKEELIQTDLSNNVEEYSQKNHNPVGCPRLQATCTKCCPLGYSRGDDGCLMCKCNFSGLYEGDILVSKKNYPSLLVRYGKVPKPDEKKARGGQVDNDMEWPKVGAHVRVPYTFDSIYGYKLDQITEAMRNFHAKTCVRFVERSDESDFVRFNGKTRGCKSYVGRQGGEQEIKIADGCEYMLGTIIHEMMHTLGFWHEQSRGDRDEHVTIVWENILPDMTSEFDKQEQGWESYGSPYDKSSVMHYGGSAFRKAAGLHTILDKESGKPIRHQRRDFSAEDVRQINLKFNCTDYIEKSTTPASLTDTNTLAATTTIAATTTAATTVS